MEEKEEGEEDDAADGTGKAPIFHKKNPLQIYIRRDYRKHAHGAASAASVLALRPNGGDSPP